MAQPRPVSTQPLVRGQQQEPVRAAFKREQVLFNRHRYNQALELLADLLGRPDLTSRQRFEALCRKAECLEQMHRSLSALKLLREITRMHPREPLGFSLLGEYLFRSQDDSRGALTALRHALKLQPKDPDTHWWMGQVYQFGLGRFRQARRAYTAALDVDAGYVSAQEALASLCESEGKWIEAIDWRKAHYRKTRDADDLAGLAELYLRLHNVVAAHKYARTATRRDPRSAGAWLAYAKTLAAQGRLSRATAALRRYVPLAGRLSGPLLSSRDFVYLEPLLDRSGVLSLLKKLPVQ